MLRVPLISCALVLSVIACTKRQPIDEKVPDSTSLPDLKVSAPSVSGEPHRQTEPARPLPPPATKIPTALQGRWTLTPGACNLGRASSKGLLVVSSGELSFYESRAVPTSDVETDGNSISGNFAFTGEGQSWTRYEALRVDKDRLMRTETNPSASFSYAKCS